MSEAFVCSVCGQTHEGLPTQWAWKLPDAVWAIPEGDREGAADFTEDVCAYDGRFFIRCVLPIPFTHQADFFGWGVWAEVGRSIFLRYLDLYEADGSGEPPLPGTLANVIDLYAAPLGQPVLIQFGTASERPMLKLANDDMSPLAREQRTGMGADRHHEILKSLGVV
ncbi:DUF2199 domain-containing protein [Nitrospirillum sp. BR 11164]|uniref:DUF2199 domain-containing protein n=1 Tax=Nitrospirillum sp. BR 11164 TaxID=3104324 RepID=UPI002AFE3AE5|nr:DUF2199 domain-containing protein [Nitrospirillum sp. BR 11164]MEA1650173.1 DUF2199 domain-containing protein [Nitrospirillum sp. BR 11164]